MRCVKRPSCVKHSPLRLPRPLLPCPLGWLFCGSSVSNHRVYDVSNLSLHQTLAQTFLCRRLGPSHRSCTDVPTSWLEFLFPASVSTCSLWRECLINGLL